MTSEKYTKICSICGCERVFKNKKSFLSNKKDKCLKCAMNSEEYKEKQKFSKLGERNGMYGNTHTKEVKEKLSKCLKLRMSIPENIKKLKTRKWTEEQKIKHKNAINNPDRIKLLRNYRLSQIKNSGGFPSYNKNACKFFDILNEKLNLKGYHALNGGEQIVEGYSIDYYDENNNLLIEWDEKRHNEPKIKQKDLIRQNYILKKLNCKFYRIDETTKKVYKVDSNDENHTDKLQELLNEFYQ